MLIHTYLSVLEKYAYVFYECSLGNIDKKALKQPFSLDLFFLGQFIMKKTKFFFFSFLSFCLGKSEGVERHSSEIVHQRHFLTNNRNHGALFPLTFSGGTRDIHIECSKQLKLNFYFYVSGQSGLFWAVLKKL